MITSKYILKLTEDYVGAETFDYEVGGGQHNSVYLSVWKNPTTSDISKIRIEGKKSTGMTPDSIRFIADANKKVVYVADGWWSVHYMIAQVAGIQYYNKRNPASLEGTADLRGGKPVIHRLFDPPLTCIKNV